MARKRPPKVSLSTLALSDLREVLTWSEEKFGHSAALRYRALLQQALRDIGADPETPGSTERPDLGEAVRTYHISLSRSRLGGAGVKRPRHFLLYRKRSDGVTQVGRILHDSRDLERHLPDDYR